MAKKTIDALPSLEGARVFVRVDFNVPMKAGVITDDTRIRAALPTIEGLVSKGAGIILASHLGRPKGGPSPELSLRPVADRLSELLGREVAFAPDCTGAEVSRLAGGVGPKGIVLLENVRFHAAEEKNDPAFAAKLIADSGASIFVNDAFGAAHRAHASTEGVARHVKTRVAGLLMDRELRYRGLALAAPERPFVAIIGGAKVSDKIAVIESLLARVDALLVGGGMAYTFLRALGQGTGRSLVEKDRIGLAGDLLARAGGKIHLPVDHVVARAFDPSAERKTVRVIEDSWLALDIGPETAAAYAQEIAGAKLVFWNGPMGVFEMEPFAHGTLAMAKALAASNGTTIVGGGDSVAAVMSMGLAGSISHVSTGGGASLEFLTGEALPGVECLDDAP
jgi:phosphoglycerate kinase